MEPLEQLYIVVGMSITIVAILSYVTWRWGNEPQQTTLGGH